MNILFTGHKGFLGRELIPELANSFKVHAFSGNLLDFDLLKRFVVDHSIERVIHAAARGGRRIREDSASTLAENFTTSVNVRNLGLPTLYFCSGAIYGRQKPIYKVREDCANYRYPNDYYGQSKFLFREIAIDDEQSTFLRYFNVFGESEGPDRFITHNVQRYRQKLPMRVFENFFMDFFYVKDSVPLIFQWLKEKEIPREINMVYEDKLSLVQVCELINGLNRYSVPIDLDSSEEGKDYCGDGSTLASLKLPMLGLLNGLTNMCKISM